LSQIPCKRPQNNSVEQVRVSSKLAQGKVTFLTAVYKIAPKYVPSSPLYLESKELLEKLYYVWSKLLYEFKPGRVGASKYKQITVIKYSKVMSLSNLALDFMGSNQ